MYFGTGMKSAIILIHYYSVVLKNIKMSNVMMVAWQWVKEQLERFLEFQV